MYPPQQLESLTLRTLSTPLFPPQHSPPLSPPCSLPRSGLPPVFVFVHRNVEASTPLVQCLVAGSPLSRVWLGGRLDLALLRLAAAARVDLESLSVFRFRELLLVAALELLGQPLAGLVVLSQPLRRGSLRGVDLTLLRGFWLQFCGGDRRGRGTVGLVPPAVAGVRKVGGS